MVGVRFKFMPFEGFPCVLKPPVNADLIGYNIGNIVINHKTVFLLSTNHRAYTWHRHSDIRTSCKFTPWSCPRYKVSRAGQKYQEITFLPL